MDMSTALAAPTKLPTTLDKLPTTLDEAQLRHEGRAEEGAPGQEPERDVVRQNANKNYMNLRNTIL